MVSFCSAWDSECWRYIYVDYMLPFKPFRITCFDSTAPGYYIAELHVLLPISLRPSLCGGFCTHKKKKENLLLVENVGMRSVAPACPAPSPSIYVHAQSIVVRPDESSPATRSAPSRAIPGTELLNIGPPLFRPATPPALLYDPPSIDVSPCVYHLLLFLMISSFGRY